MSRLAAFFCGLMVGMFWLGVGIPMLNSSVADATVRERKNVPVQQGIGHESEYVHGKHCMDERVF